MQHRLQQLTRAAALIEQALELLDGVQAPGDIAARIDHGYTRLLEVIAEINQDDN